MSCSIELLESLFWGAARSCDVTVNGYFDVVSSVSRYACGLGEEVQDR